MATLTGKTIANTYKDLLQVSNSNSGVDSTLRVISDGEATDTVLYISSAAAQITSDAKLYFRDTGLYIASNADGDLDIVSDGTAIDSINIESAGGITLDAGTASSGVAYEDDGDEMLRIFNSSSDVIFQIKNDAKDLVIQQYDGYEVVRFSDTRGKMFLYDEGGEYLQSDATDLTIASGNDINLTATTDINIPSGVGLTFGHASNQKIEGDGTDLAIDATGNINITSTVNEAGSIYVRANAGTSETVKIHSDQGTSVTEGAESVTILSDAGGIGVRSTANLANAVNVTVDGGTTSSISIFNDQGTSVTEGSESIAILSDAGGIGIRSTANLVNAVNITNDGGTSGTIQIFNDQGTSVAEGSSSIELLSDVGGVELKSTADLAKAIKLIADGGTSETIYIQSDQGTGADSIEITSDAGGVTISAGNTSHGVKVGTVSGAPVSIGHGTSETTVNDNLTVTGDLTVSGTTTTVSSSTLTIGDSLIKLAQGYTGSAYDQGIVFTRGDGANSNTQNMALIWDESADTFATIKAATEAGTTAGNVTVTDYVNFRAGAITADDASTFTNGLTVGSDGSGADVTFHSATSSDNFLWDSSEEALIITGTDGQTALNVADGNLVVADTLDVNGTVDFDVTDFDVASSGDVDLVSTSNAAGAITIRTNAGTSETIKIHADQGTSVTEGAESVTILSDAGGVGIRSTANLVNAVNITVDGGTTSTLTLFNDQGTSVTEGAASVQLLSDAGGIGIKSTANLASSILLTADGGTSETIKIHSDQGTGAASIGLVSDAGGITLDAGTDIVLDADGDQVSIKFGGATGQIDFTNANSGDGIIQQMVDAKDLVIQQYDGNEVARFGDDRKFYLYDKGGEYLSSSGSALTIASGSGAWELPASDGSSNQVLKTDGSGNLDWTSPGSVGGIDDQSSSNDDQLTITDSAIIINEDSDDLDFRVESNGNANMFFVDGGANLIGINTSSPSVGATLGLDIESTTASSASEGAALRLSSNDGAVMASGHRLGVLEFAGAEDASNTMTVGARIEAITDATWSASENGADMVFYTTDGNASQSEVMRLTADSGMTIASDLDVDGTANLDIVDIDGAVDMASTLQLDGTLTVGADGTGADVIFYSATAGDNFTWDASEECLIITGTDGAQSLKVADGDLVVVDKIYLYDNDGGEYISGDGTDLTITSGADIILAGTAVNITADTIDLSDATKDVTLNAAVDALNFDSNTLSIDASNNRVGIGTTSPVQKLTIEGDTTNAGDGTEGQLVVRGSTDSNIKMMIGVDTTSKVGFISPMDHGTAWEDLALCRHGGNVGIGGSTPHTLSVTLADTTTAHFGNAEYGADEWSGISLGYRNSGDTNNVKTKIVQEGIADGNARGHLHFLVDTAADNNSAVIADSKMMIHGTSGNVGIGTTSPARPLTVSSDGEIKALFENTSTTGGQYAYIDVESNAASTSKAYLRLITPDGTSTIHSEGTATAVTLKDGDVEVSTGDLIFGTAGKGICLGVTSNTDANTLDDYEEGTFTMGLSGVTIDSRNNSTAYYTKIGNMVYFYYYSGVMTLSSTTGGATITGLPFTSLAGGNRYGQFTTVHGNAVDGSSPGGYINLNYTTGQFVDLDNTLSASWINGSGQYLMVQGFYNAA
jgi:hypothetical protein